MRIATCVGLTGPVTVLATHANGDVASVSVGPGWIGDLDQPVGASLTLAEALGDDLVKHFKVEAPPRAGRAHRSSSAEQE